MNIEEYNFLAIRTAPDCDQLNSNLTHAALGIAGEAGEIVDTIKKVVFNGRAFDRSALVAEIGDTVWYINLLIATLGTTWEEVLTKNIAKLEARYPTNSYDHECSINRDIEKEAAAMVSVCRT